MPARTDCFSRLAVLVRTAWFLRILLFLGMQFAVVSLAGADNSMFPENWEVRSHYRYYFETPVNRLSESIRHKYLQSEDTRRVAFWIETKDESVFYLFAGESVTGEYPLLKKGNISLKRSRKDGRYDYMTVLIRNRPDSYVRIYPMQNRCTMDLVLFGTTLYRDIKLPMSFPAVIVSPFSRIIEATEQRIDWDTVLYEDRPDESLELLTEKVRENLAALPDGEDGAFDQNGNAVFISTNEPALTGLNCSGFAKWMLDGYYFPLIGSYMDIESLKVKRQDSRGTAWSERYEDVRDPYFGLDWSRNLAVLLEEARRRVNVENSEIFDVRDVKYFRYLEDVGYNVEDLELILFLLSQENPGYFYLGSLNKPYGSGPVLRQHYHLAVLIPTYTRDGRFKTVVFERNQESDLASFIERNRHIQIHLTRVEAKGTFIPMKVD